MDRVADIPGFEGLYSISERGVITQKKFNRVLKINYANKYPVICLCKRNKKYNKSVHRLLAILFIPNPLNLPHINHLNGDKNDFSLSNLEWTTISDNCKHAYRTGLAKVSEYNKKRVSETHSGANHYNSKKVINTLTGKIYDTIRAASKASGIPVQTLHRKLHLPQANIQFKFYQN